MLNHTKGAGIKVKTCTCISIDLAQVFIMLPQIIKLSRFAF